VPNILKSLALLYSIIFCSHSFAREKTIHLVVVKKSERILELVNINFFRRHTVVKTYDIMLGKDPIGHKVQEGDNKTPEGRYTLNWKNPNSAFHLSIQVDYPNAEDRAYARALEVSPGGEIFIHGMPNNIAPYRLMFPGLDDNELRKKVYQTLQGLDWTAGCIAVTNEEIQEIYRLVKVGTPIEIYP
jgi:murein L,D-transpeptidase YafK